MQKKNILLLAVFILAYAGLTFLLPQDPDTLDKYDVSANQLRLLLLTLAIPMAAIWCAAFYGFDAFKQYAHRIRKDPDGKALNKVANGLVVLGIGLPINSLISSVLNYIAQTHENFIPTAVIITNYLGLLVALIAFVLMYLGAKDLVAVTGKKFVMRYRVLFNVRS